MKLHELKKETSSSGKKRVGRGISAGGGKTAGRGTKGQNSRSGHNIPRKFEGGQTPLAMRLHKLKGFKSQKTKATVVTLDAITARFKDKEVVSLKTLTEKGLIKSGQQAKILNTGNLIPKISFGSDIKVSKSVLALIEKNKLVENKNSSKKTETE